MWPEQEMTIELLEKARHGNAEAVNQLMDRHRAILVRMIQSRLHQGMARRVDASDIVQDALIEAHRRLTDFLNQSEIPFHAWLRQLAKDRLADTYRRQLAGKRSISRDQSLPGRSVSMNLNDLFPDQQLTPAAQLIQQEFEVQFHEILELMNDETREILLMRHSEQLSNQQAAEVLGISEAAAGMRYLRALRQLKKYFSEDPSMNNGGHQ